MTINLIPAALGTSLIFRKNSALANCTRIEQAEDGSLTVVRSWPRLSSGEEMLWAVLDFVNGAMWCPSLPDLKAGLDSSNFAAAKAAIEAPLFNVEAS